MTQNAVFMLLFWIGFSFGWIGRCIHCGFLAGQEAFDNWTIKSSKGPK